MTLRIPQAAPQVRIARFRTSIDAAIQRTVDSPAYILGPEVEAFETGFAAYLGVDHCIGVNSGTDALQIACQALGLPRGGEIITVSMTASATGSAIVAAGCNPRFVDVSPDTWDIDFDQLAAAINPRTVAIMPVHLHGRPVDMPRLMAIADRYGLAVIEDCAQAHGATVQGRRAGTFGHVAAFSFYPTKNLGGIGDGGAVVTGDAQLARRARAFRSYGWMEDRGRSELAGGNSRLSELQAAILGALLPHLDSGNADRADVDASYRKALESLAVSGRIGLPPHVQGAVHHQFAVLVSNRDATIRRMAEAGIGTAVHYAYPVHRQPAFSAFAGSELPTTDHLADRLLSLPIQPEVAAAHVPEIAAALTRIVSPGA